MLVAAGTPGRRMPSRRGLFNERGVCEAPQVHNKFTVANVQASRKPTEVVRERLRATGWGEEVEASPPSPTTTPAITAKIVCF